VPPFAPAEFEEIEGKQHGLGLRLAAVKYRNAILAADHYLSIDQAGAQARAATEAAMDG
jgi:hypothetical protein